MANNITKVDQELLSSVSELINKYTYNFLKADEFILNKRKYF